MRAGNVLPSDKAKTYIPDTLVRRPAPSLPETRADDKPPELEPVLDERVLEHILGIIRMQARQMEQSPGTYAGMGEEDRRQTIVATLNTGARRRRRSTSRAGPTSSSATTGATSSSASASSGRGAGGFTEAIDQLFGYTGWRDTKLAIVMFVREKGLTAILKKAKATLEQHPQFVRWKTAAEETELRAENELAGRP